MFIIAKIAPRRAPACFYAQRWVRRSPTFCHSPSWRTFSCSGTAILTTRLVVLWSTKRECPTSRLCWERWPAGYKPRSERWGTSTRREEATRWTAWTTWKAGSSTSLLGGRSSKGWSKTKLYIWHKNSGFLMCFSLTRIMRKHWVNQCTRGLLPANSFNNR